LFWHNLLNNSSPESAQEATPASVQHFCKRQRTVRLGKVCTLENPCESSRKNAIAKLCVVTFPARLDEGGTDS